MVAFLPQHIAQLTSVVLAAALAIRLLPILITGRPPRVPGAQRPASPGRTRATAFILLLVAAGIALSGFFVDAEPSGGLRAGHWGTTNDRIFAAAWLAGIVGILVYGIWRDRRS